jgi:hypothetical protein
VYIILYSIRSNLAGFPGNEFLDFSGCQPIYNSKYRRLNI